MDGLYVVLLTPVDITMRGATFHPNVWMSCIRG
jgi:hypothetical protein